MAENDIERRSRKQVRQFGSVAAPESDFAQYSCFLCGASRYIEHRLGRIESSDGKAKLCQANCRSSRATAYVQRMHRLVRLRWRKKILQVGKREVCAQSALEGLEVRSIILRAVLESVVYFW